ncbi:methyl-accepting chemotaxis protein [Rhizobium sp. AN67]|nr:methyl-accepting chemotaxis protein [Rhizobium sp. AN67]
MKIPRRSRRRADGRLRLRSHVTPSIATGTGTRANDLRRFVEIVQSSFNSLAAGDLTVRMNERVAPEFDAIRQNLNVSVSSLEETSSNVVHAVYTIRSGLSEISTASKQQAASLEETVAALGRVTRGVNDTADGASSAQKTVNVARGDTEKGWRSRHPRDCGDDGISGVFQQNWQYHQRY